MHIKKILWRSRLQVCLNLNQLRADLDTIAEKIFMKSRGKLQAQSFLLQVFCRLNCEMNIRTSNYHKSLLNSVCQKHALGACDDPSTVGHSGLELVGILLFRRNLAVKIAQNDEDQMKHEMKHIS